MIDPSDSMAMLGTAYPPSRLEMHVIGAVFNPVDSIIQIELEVKKVKLATKRVKQPISG